MPYTFRNGSSMLAVELGLLRKLGKARRTASAGKTARAARRSETDEPDEQPPARTQASRTKPRRHAS